MSTLSNSIDWDALAAQLASRKPLEFEHLSPVQRIILTTDGTLTDILEAYALEPIQVVKLSENPAYLVGESPLGINAETALRQRKILLQGERSGINWLYAESFIVTERLHKQFNHGLDTPSQPIGKLWNTYKMETFKETLHRFEEPAAALATHFDISPDDTLICRTYRVFSQRQPIMLITDKMPKSFYIG